MVLRWFGKGCQGPQVLVRRTLARVPFGVHFFLTHHMAAKLHAMTSMGNHRESGGSTEIPNYMMSTKRFLLTTHSYNLQKVALFWACFLGELLVKVARVSAHPLEGETKVKLPT